LRGNQLIGECLANQMRSHLRFGGIIPPLAQDYHRSNIDDVVKTCFERAQVKPEQLDAIAFTNRPGLPLSLIIGTRYARYLSRTYNKPLIPIHHMHAHALTPRMEMDVKFPFLCLLISGGHSLLSYVKDIDDFTILGETIDDSPGECMDKIARMLKLINLKQFQNMSGGQAIEEAARMCKEPTAKYYFPLMLKYYRDCQFSFAGLKNTTMRHLRREKRAHSLDTDSVLPDFPDFCANLQGAIARHICHRTQRAIEYCEDEGLFSDAAERTLVISGGVACNDFIFESLRQMCEHLNFKTIRPSRRLCQDNGIMIAWNGVERFVRNLDICPVDKIYELDFYAKCPLGESHIDKVKEKNIACNWIKTSILKPYAKP
jgi:N6-L-threonylcarbamoyladenine synthase